MQLSGLLPLLADLPEFRQLCEVAGTAAPDARPAEDELPAAAAQAVVREAAKPFLVAGLQQQVARPIVLVAADSARAQEW